MLTALPMLLSPLIPLSLQLWWYWMPLLHPPVDSTHLTGELTEFYSVCATVRTFFGCCKTIDWLGFTKFVLHLSGSGNAWWPDGSLEHAGSSINDDALQHLKLFIPLSMLTTSALTHIHFNDDLKYKKILFSYAAGKYALDDSYFPSEQSLSDANYIQAHKKWVALVKLTADANLYEGWKAHHNIMMGYEDLVTWAPAWCIHDRQLRALFMTQPFFVDPKSITYRQQFKQACVNTIATTSQSSTHPDQEWCASSSHYMPYDCDCSRKEPHTNDTFQPFSEVCPTLCLCCRNTGHHANMCKSESSQADRPIRVSWKVDKLVSKAGCSICITFNVKGSCQISSSAHHKHSCSLCGDPHHGATRCTHNWAPLSIVYIDNPVHSSCLEASSRSCRHRIVFQTLYMTFFMALLSAIHCLCGIPLFQTTSLQQTFCLL